MASKDVFVAELINDPQPKRLIKHLTPTQYKHLRQKRVLEERKRWNCFSGCSEGINAIRRPR